MEVPEKARSGLTPALILFRFLPFWIFLTLYKFGASLHYELLAPFGAKVLPLWIVGLVIGVASLVQMILDVPAGYLLDRFGYRRLLMLTSLIFVFAGIALMFTFTIHTYFISLAIGAIGWTLFGPGINAYALSHAPRAYSGIFMAYRDSFGSLGVVLASAILGYILSFNVFYAGYVVAILTACAFFVLSFAPKDTVRVAEEKNIDFHGYYVRRSYFYGIVHTMRRLNPASTVLLLLGFSSSVFYGFIWFVVPIVIANQSDGTLLSLGLGIFDFAIVVLGYMLGKMADDGNKRTLVFFGLLLFAVAGALLGIDFGWLFLLFGFLTTSGDEMASVSLWSWLHALDREHAEDGVISGIINLFQDLGWAVGPILAGILYTLIGPSWTITFGAVFLFATWCAYHYMVRGHKSHPSTPGIHKPSHKRHRV